MTWNTQHSAPLDATRMEGSGGPTPPDPEITEGFHLPSTEKNKIRLRDEKNLYQKNTTIPIFIGGLFDCQTGRGGIFNPPPPPEP